MDTIPHPVGKPNGSQSAQWVDTSDGSDGDEGAEFKPLTREEALRWRSNQPSLSMAWILVWQLVFALLAASLAALLTRDGVVVQSMLYGCAAVMVPSALMAWGVTSSALARRASGVAQAALVNFFVWEGIKLALVVILMALAPVVLGAVNWLALVVGLVVVLKVVGLVVFVQSKRRR
ncbi:MAG: hypothetical protein RL297_2038 [Pseudomonadota bacterium]|jgi:ATP synthase protein I